MNAKEFHDKFLKHLKHKKEDVGKIVALETNLEKWFQGEMALGFSSSKVGYRLLSSNFYNNYTDYKSPDEREWNKLLGERGIVVTEAAVYRPVKRSTHESTGVRKVDFLLETKEEVVLSEIKILWLHELKNDSSAYTYLETKDVLENVQRLKKHTYKEFRHGQNGKAIYLCLTLICVSPGNHTKDAKEVKEIKTIQRIIDKYLNREITIFPDDVCFCHRGNNSVCWVPPSLYQDQLGYSVYLVTVDLS